MVVFVIFWGCVGNCVDIFFLVCGCFIFYCVGVVFVIVIFVCLFKFNNVVWVRFLRFKIGAPSGVFSNVKLVH